jgi:hypothetical protein
MKRVLTGAAVLVLATTPAWARHPREWVDEYAGQKVFSVQDVQVGRLDRYIDLHGTPGAIITTDEKLGGGSVIVPAEDLGWRAKGGLLLALPNVNLMHMPRYQPGWALPFW